MRARLAVASAFLVVLSATVGAFQVPAQAARVHLAQGGGGNGGQDEDVEQRPGQPSESPSPSPTEEEAGPPWTYQMARISLLLVALMLLGVGATYYRLVVRRQRGEA